LILELPRVSVAGNSGRRSLALSMAFFLAFVERQIRYSREVAVDSSTSYPQL
jgi:hypothetical protein